MRVRITAELSIRTLVGLPEIAPHKFQSRLLTAGIYSRIRYPRYVEIFVALVGWAMIANYVATYVFALLAAGSLFLVVLLDERELRERFGSEYEAYALRVPRFIPANPRRPRR